MSAFQSSGPLEGKLLQTVQHAKKIKRGPCEKELERHEQGDCAAIEEGKPESGGQGYESHHAASFIKPQ